MILLLADIADVHFFVQDVPVQAMSLLQKAVKPLT